MMPWLVRSFGVAATLVLAVALYMELSPKRFERVGGVNFAR